jgi:hypothetical protein
MKKITLVLIVSVILAGTVSAQKLIDIYKNGPVRLIPEKTYGMNNNWESLFNMYYDSITPNVGSEKNKKIVVAPDGSVFMSHKNRHEIWKFGPDGNLAKRIGSKGSKPGQFVMLPTVHQIAENKYVFTSDLEGRINFFDLTGNFVKTIKLDYTGQEFQPVGNDDILLYGFAVWKEKVRNMVVRLNITSGSKEILYDYFNYPPGRLTVGDVDSLIKAKRGNYNIRMPGTFNASSYNDFTFLPDGRFMRSESESGEYTIYSSAGKELLKSRMEIDQVKITEADVQANYEMVKKNFIRVIEECKKVIDPANRKNNPDWSPVYVEKQMNTYQRWLDNVDIYRDIRNYYPYFPFFSNIISDDEGNLLVFEYTSNEEKKSNIFNVIAFDSKGQKLARTSFVCDDYGLSFSRNMFVISKGYVYAIAKLKNFKGMPLRLVKFRISN